MKAAQLSAIPESMQAVRLHGRGFDKIRVETVPVPEPNERQLLVRVDAAGVCTSILKLVAQGTDHTFINGWDLERFPIILGDEGSVTVVKVGAELAAKYPLGQRYATQPAVDHPPLNFRERYRHGARGMEKVAIGYSLPGHLSEYMLVTEETLAAQCLVPLPSTDIPFFAGALCEPLSCVISAQERHVHLSQTSPLAPRRAELGLLRGGITLIIGAGPMGRLQAEAALRYKPRHLIITDLLEERLQWLRQNLAAKAHRAGVDLQAVPSAAAAELLKQVSAGQGADDIIVAVGVRQVQIDAQQWLAKGGNLNLFGGLKRGEHILDLDALRVHYDEIRLCGSSGGSPADVAIALGLVASGEIDAGQHLDMVGSLDQFPQALEMIRQTTVEGKIVLYPHIRQTDLQRVKNWTRAEELRFVAEHKSV